MSASVNASAISWLSSILAMKAAAGVPTLDVSEISQPWFPKEITIWRHFEDKPSVLTIGSRDDVTVRSRKIVACLRSLELRGEVECSGIISLRTYFGQSKSAERR